VNDTCDPQWIDTRLAALSIREIRALKAAAWAEGAFTGWMRSGESFSKLVNPYLEEDDDDRA
jgi:hypothetical protein